MHNTRYLEQLIIDDLTEKMVFLGGPRQVGKTTLSKKILGLNGTYYNWDDLEDKKKLLNNDLYKNNGLVVLDEIHKYRLWRSLVKGCFDKYFPKIKILVTGSARLDHFRKGGDSLVGRYHYYRLHPYSLPELSHTFDKSVLQDLLQYGGFPEPLHKKDKRHLRRWQNERISRVLTQDVRDLETIKDISLLELLVELLFPRVGSPLSIKSLQEDIGVSPHTVERWIGILENVYFCYRISPYGTHRTRAIKKTQKLYLWDWSQVESDGARFENLVAGHLLKFCHYHEDYNGYKMQLCYIKDVEGREIDFVVIKDKKPLFAVECKTGEKSLQRSLKYFKDIYKIPKAYQVHLGEKDFGDESKEGRVLPFHLFCKLEELI
ncbi:MAG: ATP-binding protein [Bacteriovoracaceae bacterium]